ncbi:MAG: GAF domain-containing protein, partial [Anaerolineae bacterium]|nr:GAF domain-containing protein [Anaerolineae bacterium]
GVINQFQSRDVRETLLFFNPIVPEGIGNGELVLIQTLDVSIAQREVLEYVGQVGFPIIVGAVVLLFILFQLLDQLITPPLLQLVDAMRGVVRGYYDVPLPARIRDDEIGTLTNTFIDMREKIKSLTQEMEARLQARIHDVQVTQDITRAITAERDLGYLMNQVVDLIIDNFPQIYHAQIFLLDAREEYAVLRASTGDVGQELLQRGHKLRVGSISVIGQVVELGEYNIARDTASSSIHRRNEFLPETRAELAVPLRFGKQIIGALDVQSRQRDSFSEDFINTMQTLADQISVAIENARLYEQSARLLADLQRQRRGDVREAWTEFLRARRMPAHTQQSGVVTETDFSELTQAAYLNRKTIVGSVTARGTVPFVVPVVMKDTTIGTVEYEVPQAEFSQNKVLLAEDLVGRLAISLENSRLFQESRQVAQRERLVNDIAATLAMETD